MVVNYLRCRCRYAKEKAILKDMERCVLTRERKHLRLHRNVKAKVPIIETKEMSEWFIKRVFMKRFMLCIVSSCDCCQEAPIIQNKNILNVVIFERVCFHEA